MKCPLWDTSPEPRLLKLLFSFDANNPSKALLKLRQANYFNAYSVKLQKVAHTSVTEGKNMLYSKLCLRIISLSRDFQHETQAERKQCQLEMKQSTA